MKKIVIVLWVISSSIWAKSSTQRIGDVLATAIPVVAYGSTFYMDDEEGREAFYWSYGATMATTLALKYSVKEKRPDTNTRDSFPSGHTSSAFSGAAFIHKRYGFSYAIPAYLGAIYVGYSRVHVHRHYPKDVVAGALIGMVSAWYFVDPLQKLSIVPEVDSEYKGIQVNYKF